MKGTVNTAWAEVAVKPMETKDLAEVVSIAASSPLTIWSEKMFAGEMKNPFSRCFVATVQTASTEQVVGVICFRALEGESELLNLCVHPRYRRRSVARRLMQFYIDFCHRKDIKTFYLEVGLSNEFALRLYRSFSYEPAGTRKNFYGGKSDALLMARRET